MIRETRVRRGGKKNRKHGRNEKKCEAYRFAKKHEKSHVRRLERHIRVYKDGSAMARNALEKYQRMLRK